MTTFHIGQLSAWQHVPTGEPLCRILLIHGISEHSGRHRKTVDFLVRSGIEVVRFDLRGAGLSGGPRQFITHFNDYVEDTSRIFHWIERELPLLPLFLFGHSMGGAVALHFSSIYGGSLKGLLLSAPAFRVGPGISPAKIRVGKYLSKIIPTFKMPNGSDGNFITRDPDEVKAYESDSLRSKYNTVQQGIEILKALEKIPLICESIETPTAIFHGSGDRIIQLEGSFELLQLLGSKSPEMFVVPGGYHELHNDIDREYYFSLLLQWIRRHVK